MNGSMDEPMDRSIDEQTREYPLRHVSVEGDVEAYEYTRGHICVEGDVEAYPTKAIPRQCRSRRLEANTTLVPTLHQCQHYISANTALVPTLH